MFNDKPYIHALLVAKGILTIEDVEKLIGEKTSVSFKKSVEELEVKLNS